LKEAGRTKMRWGVPGMTLGRRLQQVDLEFSQLALKKEVGSWR